MQMIKISVPAKTYGDARKQLKEQGYHIVASIKQDENRKNKDEFICKVVV